MPTPREGEDKSSYISRCIKYCMDNEGTEQKAAVGKCYGMWDSYQKKSNVAEKINIFVGGSNIKSSTNKMKLSDYIEEAGTVDSDLGDLTPAGGTTGTTMGCKRTKALPPTVPKKKKKKKEKESTSILKQRLMDTKSNL